MDDRVNCMACLVADDDGILSNGVAKDGTIVHALARTGGNRQTAHHLCAFNNTGTLRCGVYWTSRVEEEAIIRSADLPFEPNGNSGLACSRTTHPIADDDVQADALSPGELDEDGKQK